MHSGLHLLSTPSTLALMWYVGLVTIYRTSPHRHPLMRSSSTGRVSPFSTDMLFYSDGFPFSLCYHFGNICFLSRPLPSMSISVNLCRAFKVWDSVVLKITGFKWFFSTRITGFPD